MHHRNLVGILFLSLSLSVHVGLLDAQDAKNDPALLKYGIYEKTAPRPETVQPIKTRLPIVIKRGHRIALIGNTLFERSQQYGHFETMLQKHFAGQKLIVRNLSWSADTIDTQPRPENFADLEQHLFHEKIDIIFAAFGFNESFADEPGLKAFREKLTKYLARLKSLAFNGRTGPMIVLVSPIANENVAKVDAADRNNARIQLYANTMRLVAQEQGIGFVDVFKDTQESMASPGSDVTTNGCHLNELGDWIFANALFKGAFWKDPPNINVNEDLRQAVIDRDRQYVRRYRPLNTFYYTGGRNKDYGYLDFLPAMQSFDRMVANRDERIWALAEGRKVPTKVDDSNVPEMPAADESRGVNEWLSPADEQKAFKVDPRFEVNLFASEVEFPEIANPIAMRFDARGRLWVSTSITYPHIYPGNEPKDRLVILEDSDNDGRADRSTVFAENLHVPLSFELGDGGVYVSEQPELTFLADADGNDTADSKRIVMSGFGTEDSHHALHDFVWSPDGDLLFRESIFHHTQVETPYGPVRQQNSGWFRYTARNERLTSFGSYPSTNPWGVTFDDWGRHVASHPIFAAAFHSVDPPYPAQHPAPNGLRAYSGTCGHQFVNTASFPKELQGAFIKARYKPTNRIEMHQWVRQPFGYDEQYLGDLLFSTNLSFIPVDVQFGPRGDLYICDWYNPVKGHAQYSLRDTRRDRISGRIWRIVAKGLPLQNPPKLVGATVEELVEGLERPEYEYRYRVKRELRSKSPADVNEALDHWLANLSKDDPRYRHHQLEALWTYRTIGNAKPALIRELASCESADARAAAIQQLRYTSAGMDDAIKLLKQGIQDVDGLVRMEAVIAASYIGSKAALEALLEVFQQPMGEHLTYAVTCSLGSRTLRPIWESNPQYGVDKLLKKLARSNEIKEPRASAKDSEFDSQVNLQTIRIGCEPERMLFTMTEFTATPGQAIKLVFTNPDATDHNLVFVKPGTLSEVGMAANDMAKDPKNADSDFIPADKQSLILHASPMIGPTRKSKIHVFRFEAPSEPGVYPYVCTFPGHWIIMNGRMIVGRNEAEVESLRASQKPKIIQEWTMKDFPEVGASVSKGKNDDEAIVRGSQAFLKAQCQQCHIVSGHGVNLGPDLTETVKKFQGNKLLQQVLEPSFEIHPKYQVIQFLLDSGKVVSGVIAKEDGKTIYVATNLLAPQNLTKVAKDEIDERQPARSSAMPQGMVNVLTKEEIIDMLHFLESGPAPMMQHAK
jgi:putative heme-binding domain-containing protein